MKSRLVLACAAVAVLVVPIAATAGSATDRATGGGQILFGTQGAGNTIAFTAQGTSDAARGNVQYVNREAGTGRAQTVLHGRVSCLRVEGNMAKIAGTWDQGGDFQLLVADNGEGAAAAADMVTVQNNQDPNCEDDEDDDDGRTELGRGNVQVYDAG